MKKHVGFTILSFLYASENQGAATEGRCTIGVVGGVIGLFATIMVGSSYWQWCVTKFLSSDKRDRLDTAMSLNNDDRLAEEYPLLEFVTTLGFGAADGLIEQSNWVSPHRRFMVYELNPTIVSR